VTRAGYLLLGLTAIVAALAGILAFAVSKFIAAARAATKSARTEGGETAFMAAAMEDALSKMRSQERAMKARAEASERLSSEIVASMTSGLLVVAQDGLVRMLNPAGRRLLGLPDAEWTRSYREVLSEATQLADVIDECLTTRSAIVRRAVKMNRPGTGASYHLGITVSPIRDDAGHAHGAICLFTDLSNVIDLEEQLRLKDSLARVGELTAGIAHEFRNGLATIHGYSRLLDLERLPADFKPYVQGIRDETEALGQVVTNFLNFAKPAELTLAPVDIGAIAERAAEEIRGEARARGGDVTVRGTFGVVEGDEVLLRQAFSNLCRNALEACTEGRPQIVVEGVREGNGSLRVSVTDNGPGLDPKVADRIFRPFFTTKARGTGLGLALVQKIIVTHNGRISAANVGSGGACLTVTLPLRSA
jgi:PAS domain S-box-containing protein